MPYLEDFKNSILFLNVAARPKDKIKQNIEKVTLRTQKIVKRK